MIAGRTVTAERIVTTGGIDTVERICPVFRIVQARINVTGGRSAIAGRNNAGGGIFNVRTIVSVGRLDLQKKIITPCRIVVAKKI